MVRDSQAIGPLEKICISAVGLCSSDWASIRTHKCCISRFMVVPTATILPSTPGRRRCVPKQRIVSLCWSPGPRRSVSLEPDHPSLLRVQEFDYQIPSRLHLPFLRIYLASEGPFGNRMCSYQLRCSV